MTSKERDDWFTLINRCQEKTEELLGTPVGPLPDSVLSFMGGDSDRNSRAALANTLLLFEIVKQMLGYDDPLVED
jgi:hypothetical protein